VSTHASSRWTAAWVGAAALGVVNGTVRDLLYRDKVGELAAHQVSTATLIAALAAYARALERRWPLARRHEAWTVGARWLALTVAFEFTFGHYVAGDSWTELARNYDVRKGRIWGIVPLSMAVLPALTRRA
jgi:hypothetical protein